MVSLDEERTASMVSNLMVVLCGDQPASPIVNAGVSISELSAGRSSCASTRPSTMRWPVGRSDELRSVNAQIEIVLRRALLEAGPHAQGGGGLPEAGPTSSRWISRASGRRRARTGS